MQTLLSFAKKAKEGGATVAIGGPWATVKAEQIAQNQPAFDYIVRGEGEAPLGSILLGESSKGVLRGGDLHICELPSINLSGWTDSDLLEYQDNYKNMLESGNFGEVPDPIPFFVFYHSSRGCIQKPRCGFCGSRLGKKYVIRTDEQFYQDVEEIIKQISHINERIHVFDCSDSFTSGIHRFGGEFRPFPGVTYTAYARSKEITPKVARHLRELGVTKVSVGIESGSSRSMGMIGKGTTLRQNTEAVKMLSDEEMSVYVNLLYGIPGETLEDIEKTVDHFEEIAELGNIYRVAGRIVTTLPDSRWYSQMLKKIGEENIGLRDQIHNDDKIDSYRIQDLWLNEMTELSLEEIHDAHERLVDIAKKHNISISSESPRGLV